MIIVLYFITINMVYSKESNNIESDIKVETTIEELREDRKVDSYSSEFVEVEEGYWQERNISEERRRKLAIQARIKAQQIIEEVADDKRKNVFDSIVLEWVDESGECNTVALAYPALSKFDVGDEITFRENSTEYTGIVVEISDDEKEILCQVTDVKNISFIQRIIEKYMY